MNQSLTNAITTQITNDLLQNFQNFYRETNTSNSNLLGILLPVVAAWVGAILAFYYGNKNLDRLSENYNSAIKSLHDNTTD